MWSWGLNSSGQLGDGSTTQRTTPVAVSGLANVVAIAAGNTHSVALKSDGSVWAWGLNNVGQLGDGTSVNRLTPVPMSGLSGIQAIGAGDETLTVRADGSVTVAGVTAAFLLSLTQPDESGLGTLNLDLRPMLFHPRVDLTQNVAVQSNYIVMSGIAGGSAISVAGGSYKIDAGAFTTSPGTVSAGQTVTLRQTASANCGTTTTTTLSLIHI